MYHAEPGLLVEWASLLSKHTCQRSHKNMRRCGLVHELSVCAVTVNVAIAAVEHERDVSLFQDGANFRRVVLLQPVVENSRGKRGMAGMNAGCRQGMSQKDTRPGSFEKFLDVECNERLILDDKHQSPIKLAGHDFPVTLRNPRENALAKARFRHRRPREASTRSDVLASPCGVHLTGNAST
jgi:hypothetical protein